MQATISYLLTEQAQRAAMAATGQPVARKQTVTIDATPEDLALLAVDDDGTPYLNIADTLYQLKRENLAAADALCGSTNYNRATTRAEISPYGADVLALIRAAYAKREADKQSEIASRTRNGEHNRRITEEAYRRFLANPNARIDDLHYLPLGEPAADLRSPADFWPRDHAEFMSEASRRNSADVAAKKAAEQAKEQAKSDFIAQWVAENPDEETKAQFADGLLCRGTILSLIADAAFSAVGIGEAVTVPDTCQSRECPCCDTYVDCLPRGVYPAWRALKSQLPAGFEVKFSKVRECLRDEDYDGEGESAGPAYYTADITIPHGPFRFERKVRL